ncbi:hypothetical protein, partial [Enterobacter asburiae]
PSPTIASGARAWWGGPARALFAPPNPAFKNNPNKHAIDGAPRPFYNLKKKHTNPTYFNAPKAYFFVNFKKKTTPHNKQKKK